SENALLRDKPLTLEQYLAEPYLAEPFRAADCCLVNDGAGAFVMTSVERARDLRQPPVTVLGVGAGVSEEGEYASLRTDYLATAAAHSAPRAFAMAGLTPAEVDFVTLYDNFTSMVIQQLEDMGFCGRGEGGPFVGGGRIALGGVLPVNPSGGRLFTWVRVHRAFLPGYKDRVPFLTALVELEEDARLRLAAFLRDAPPGGLRVGLAVEVTFERVDERLTLPIFRCRA